MATSYLYDRVQVRTNTQGTGSMMLGAAVSGWRTFVQASVPDQTYVSYLIVDGSGWEYGSGRYLSPSTLERGLTASSTGSLLYLSGAATITIAPRAVDLRPGGGAAGDLYQIGPDGVTPIWAGPSQVLPGLTPNIRALGADGVGDDTAAFIAAEALTSSTIDLGGGTYSLVSAEADPVNGVRLTKDYKNGRLLKDGRPFVMDLDRGLADSAKLSGDLLALVPPSRRLLGIYPVSSDEFQVWAHISGYTWKRYLMTRASSAVPFNWAETRLVEKLQYVTSDDAAVAYVSPWVTGTAYLSNTIVTHLSNAYRATGGATSGATAPTHTSGTASDGGVTWAYVSDWTTATVYAAGATVKQGNNYYRTTAGGTSGATAPTHTTGTVNDGGVDWIYNAAWTNRTVDGFYRFGSGSASLYVGGRMAVANVAGQYVEYTFTGGGDVYVIVTTRTSGNYLNVLLDGAQAYLALPDDGSGNRVVDTYSATDLQYKTAVLIASGVPEGEHVVRLTLSAAQNASSSATVYGAINALAFDGTDSGPWLSDTDAPQWVTGTAYLAYQVVQNAGKYYYASADGTSGATAPTHSSGAVSDGAVTWNYVATSSYALNDQVVHSPGSQACYAGEIKPAASASFEDFGGAVHGNLTQLSEALSVNTQTANMIAGAWLLGERVTLRQVSKATHADSGSDALLTITQAFDFTTRGLSEAGSATVGQSVVIGYFYTGMCLANAYESTGGQRGVRRVYAPSSGNHAPVDYAGVSNPIVGRGKDFVIAAFGDALPRKSTTGAPSTIPTANSYVTWVSIGPQGVDHYRNTTRLFAGKAMNISGAGEIPETYTTWTTATVYAAGATVRNGNNYYRTTAGGTSGATAPVHTSGSASDGGVTWTYLSNGFSSFVCKFYFEFNATATPLAMATDETLEWSNFYGLAIIPKEAT